MDRNLVGVLANGDFRHDAQFDWIDGQHTAAGPIGDVKPRTVAGDGHVVGATAERDAPLGLLAAEVGNGERAGVDVEPVKQVVLGVERQPAAEASFGRDRLGLAFFACRRRWVAIVNRRELAVGEVEDVRGRRAAARPIELVFSGRQRQTEPALVDRGGLDLRLGVEIDERQLMHVIAASGHEGSFAIGQWQDVERQIGERHLFAGRRDLPTVGKQIAVGLLAGELRLVFGAGGQNDQSEDSHCQENVEAHEFSSLRRLNGLRGARSVWIAILQNLQDAGTRPSVMCGAGREQVTATIV